MSLPEDEESTADIAEDLDHGSLRSGFWGVRDVLFRAYHRCWVVAIVKRNNERSKAEAFWWLVSLPSVV